MNMNFQKIASKVMGLNFQKITRSELRAKCPEGTKEQNGQKKSRV